VRSPVALGAVLGAVLLGIALGLVGAPTIGVIGGLFMGAVIGFLVKRRHGI